MNRKLIKSSWCYRCKLLSLWISSLHILGYFCIHCILKMCYENTPVQGWVGVRLKRIFDYRDSWGVQKWPFGGVSTLWMAPWPGVICSDPGSQLEAASGKLENWWLTMGDALRTLGSSKNFRWDVSPADSPWRQGKAERRIGVVKKLLSLSLGDTRVSPVELQTVLFECANICNERPIITYHSKSASTWSLNECLT